MKINKLRRIINEAVNGSTFISIDTITAVRLKGGKGNPFQNRVTKVAVGHNVMIFQNKRSNAYENMVRRRLEAEGKSPDMFELSERKWGTRIPNTPFVEHNGNYYLEVIFLKCGKVDILVDGMPYSGAIEGMEPAEEAEQGGLENKVVLRTYAVESLTAITLDGTRYDL